MMAMSENFLLRDQAAAESLKAHLAGMGGLAKKDSLKKTCPDCCMTNMTSAIIISR